MASPGSHENRLTFSSRVALPGVAMRAGRYSFDVMDSALDIVVVRNIARTKVFYFGFVNQVSRPNGMSPNTLVTMGEAP